MRDRLSRIRSLDSIETLVRDMPAVRRKEFLDYHMLPKVDFAPTTRTVEMPAVPERGGEETRRTIQGYPDPPTRRLISKQLTEDVTRRGQSWRAVEAGNAAQRTAQAHAAYQARTFRQVRRLALLNNTRLRFGAIGGAAVLAGAAGYGAVRGLQAALGKGFDGSKHPRGEHGRFASAGTALPAFGPRRRKPARADFAEAGDPPRVTMLVGMPGSGKSTWRALRMAQAAIRPTTIISSDDMVEDVGRRFGLSFSEAFKRLDAREVNTAHRLALRVAIKAGHDVVIDRVNASAKGRAKWLRRVPAHYETHAVVFDAPEHVLRERRAQRAGKHIPERALGEMRDAYKAPGPGEFDYVHRARQQHEGVDSRGVGSGAVLGKASPKSEPVHPMDAADAAEKAMAARLAKMFGAWTDGIEEKLLSPDASSLHSDMSADLDHALQPLDGAVRAGASVPVLVGGGDGKTIAFSFLARDPAVTEFVDRYRQDKIVELADEQRAAIKQQLIEAAMKGASPQEMARRIKETIGLTSAQMQHVQNYRTELEELNPGALDRKLRDARFDKPINRAIDTDTAIDPDKISQYVDAYHRRYLAYRAMTIARTEGVGGANNGQAATAAALVHGQPGMTVEKTWIATDDERTRHDHRELNGVTVLGLETPFKCDSGDEIRWPHDPSAPARQVVHCRCGWVTRLVPDTDAPDADPNHEETSDV